MRHAMRSVGVGSAVALLFACSGDHVTLPQSGPMAMTNMPMTVVGSGVAASESRPVAGFTAVTVTGTLRVVLQQTGSESLIVTADDNVLPLVRTEVRGGRLFLGLAPNISFARMSEVVCLLSMGELRNLDVSGAARVEMTGIASGELGLYLGGTAVASASGVVERLALDASGASRFMGALLGSRSVTAGLSGTSHAVVRASDSLVARASGISVLEYYGSPAVSSTVDGLSVVRRLGP